MTGGIPLSAEPGVHRIPPQDSRGLEPPWLVLSERFQEGQLIPFLGAAASSYNSNQAGGAPPSVADLTAKLAMRAQLPLDCGVSGSCHRPIFDLPRLASYYQTCIELRQDLDSLLYDEIANPGYAPNPLHHLLARIARRKPMLIITTNYDDLLEKAFESPANKGLPVPYEVVVTPADDLSYAADSDDDIHLGPEYAGHVLHWVSGQNQSDFTPVLGSELTLDLTQRSVIYKIHGSVPRGTSWPGGYIIAEEDYARFLGQMDKKLVPEPIMSRIARKTKIGRRAVRMFSLLFLGYSMRDWNLRVLFEQLHLCQGVSGEERHYAFMKAPESIDRRLMEKRGVEVYDCDLARFVEKMSEQVS